MLNEILSKARITLFVTSLSVAGFIYMGFAGKRLWKDHEEERVSNNDHYSMHHK